MDYSKTIQDTAIRLFAENRIDVFIGYTIAKNGKHVPLIINQPSACKQLVFDSQSAHNLTNYLQFEHAKNKRVGIVVKGCDSRSLNMLMTEKQVKRENLYIIGICCEGIENGEMEDRCKNCIQPNALIYDELLGTPRESAKFRLDAEVAKLRAMPTTERGAFFDEIFANCIRCNACRHSCPLCYCDHCVIDQESATFHNAAVTVANSSMALLTWSLHLAGRCVDCRNCERACPQNLPLHLLHKQNESVIYENFQHHLAGVEPNERGAFYKYNLNDPDDFIL